MPQRILQYKDADEKHRKGKVMRGGEIHLPSGNKSERQLKALMKGPKERMLDESATFPDAAKVIEKLTKRIIKLEKQVKVSEAQYNKLYAALIQLKLKGCIIDKEE